MKTECPDTPPPARLLTVEGMTKPPTVLAHEPSRPHDVEQTDRPRAKHVYFFEGRHLSPVHWQRCRATNVWLVWLA